MGLHFPFVFVTSFFFHSCIKLGEVSFDKELELASSAGFIINRVQKFRTRLGNRWVQLFFAPSEHGDESVLSNLRAAIQTMLTTAASSLPSKDLSATWNWYFILRASMGSDRLSDLSLLRVAFQMTHFTYLPVRGYLASRNRYFSLLASANKDRRIFIS